MQKKVAMIKVTKSRDWIFQTWILQIHKIWVKKERKKTVVAFCTKIGLIEPFRAFPGYMANFFLRGKGISVTWFYSRGAINELYNYAYCKELTN